MAAKARIAALPNTGVAFRAPQLQWLSTKPGDHSTMVAGEKLPPSLIKPGPPRAVAPRRVTKTKNGSPGDPGAGHRQGRPARRSRPPGVPAIQKLGEGPYDHGQGEKQGSPGRRTFPGNGAPAPEPAQRPPPVASRKKAPATRVISQAPRTKGPVSWPEGAAEATQDRGQEVGQQPEAAESLIEQEIATALRTHAAGRKRRARTRSIDPPAAAIAEAAARSIQRASAIRPLICSQKSGRAWSRDQNGSQGDEGQARLGGGADRPEQRHAGRRQRRQDGEAAGQTALLEPDRPGVLAAHIQEDHADRWPQSWRWRRAAASSNAQTCMRRIGDAATPGPGPARAAGEP